MANGIIIDVGFVSTELEEYINKIKKNFEAVDFNDAIGLEKSFKEQVKNVRTELDKLEKEIKSSVGGKSVSDLQDQYKGLSKTVTGLVDIIKEIGKAIPANTNITNMISDMEMVAKNATAVRDTLSEISEVSKNNKGTISIVNSSETDTLKEVLDIFEKIIDDQEKTSSYNSGRKKEIGIIKDLAKAYQEYLDIFNDVDENSIDLENVKSIEKLIQKIKDINSILDVLDKKTKTSFEVTFDVLGFSLKEIQTEMDSTLRQYIELSEENFARLDTEKQRREEAAEKTAKNAKTTANTVTKELSKNKRGQIQIPLRVSDNAEENLTQTTLRIIGELQKSIDKKPIEVRLAFTSRYLTKKNEELLEQLKNEMDNISDDNAKEKLNTLIEDLNKQFGKQLKLDIQIKGEKEISERMNSFVNKLKELFKEADFNISPHIVLTDEEKVKLQKEINELTGGIFLNIGIATEDGIKSDKKSVLQEINVLDSLNTKIKNITESVNNKTQAFLDEEDLVTSSVSNETEFINQLYGQLLLVTEEAQKLSSTFSEGFSFNYNISTDAIDDFKRILDDINNSVLRLADSIGNIFGKSNTSNATRSQLTEFPILVNENAAQSVQEENKELSKSEVLLKEINDLWELISSNRTGKTSRSSINEKEEIEHLTVLAEKLHELKNIGGIANLGLSEKDKKLVTKYYMSSNVSKNFDDVGEDAVENYRSGILDKKPEVISAVNEVIQAGIEAAADTQDSHSPSEEYKELGRQAIQGYIDGIKEKRDELEKVISDVISSGLSSAKIKKSDSDNITHILLGLNDLVKSINGKNSDIKIEKMSENLNKLSSAISAFSIKKSPALSQLNDILNRSKELENLVKILSASEKKIAAVSSKESQNSLFTEAYANLMNHEGDISDSVQNFFNLSGATVLTKNLEAAADGFVKITALVKETDDTYKEYILHTIDGSTIETEKVSENTAAILRQANALNKIKTIINGQPQQNIGSLNQVFTMDNTAQWYDLLDLMERFGIESKNVTEIIRNLNGEQESFVVKGTDGVTEFTKIIGISSDAILAESDYIVNVTKSINDFEKGIRHLSSSLKSAFKGDDVATVDFIRQFEDIVSIFNNINSKKIVDGGIISNDDIERLRNYFLSFQTTLVASLDKLDIDNKTENFREKVKSIKELIESFTSSLSVDKNLDSDAFNRVVDGIRSIYAEINNADNRLAKKTSIDKLLSKISDNLYNNHKMSKTLQRDFEDLANTIKSFGDNLSQDRLNKFNEQYMRLYRIMKEEGNLGNTFWDNVSNRISSKYQELFARYLSFQDIIRYTRQIFSSIRELDTALVDLRKTTSMTVNELDKFYFSANNIAKQMGVTTKEIIDQASAFSRLGYSTKYEAEQMAQLSSQFASISPDMDVSTATDGLVSVMKAFDVEVSDVERKILDNINIIGNTAATSNGEIVDMLMRSSSAMKEANNSLEETIALETAAVEITRSAESTGTAFKTVAMRIRGYDEETEELSDDLKDIAGDIANLTKINGKGGISLFTDAEKTEYKSTYQILKEISDIYDQLTDKQQAELLEKLAGKRGGQVVGALLNNFNTVENALINMENAAGSADREMEVIRDSIDFKINELSQTWIGIWQNLLDRGDVGEVIELLTALSNSLGFVIDKLGLLGSSGAILGSVFAIKNFGRVKMFTL